MAQPGLSLHEGERRFLDYHRRRNHSRRTLEHYQDSVAVFRKYLAAKKKPQLVGLLTCAGHLAQTPTFSGIPGTNAPHSAHQ